MFLELWGDSGCLSLLTAVTGGLVGVSPAVTAGLAGPLPGAGKLLLFCSGCFSGCWEDGELRWWGERELPTLQLLCFATL